MTGSGSNATKRKKKKRNKYMIERLQVFFVGINIVIIISGFNFTKNQEKRRENIISTRESKRL